MKVFFCLTLAALALSAAPYNPVVAILTKPVDEDDPSKGSFLSHTLVRWLSSAGMRVIPLLYDMPEAQRLEVLSKVNGVMLPGGGTALHYGLTYFEAGRSIVEYAQTRAVAGDPFPVFGVCLGYELMAIAIAGTEDVLEVDVYDASDYPIPLEFTSEAKNSVMFGDAPDLIWNSLATENVTLNDHVCGVTLETFQTNQKLNDMFVVTSTNVDRKGQGFVSTIESRNPDVLPLFATQWHPECNSWLLGSQTAPHHSMNGVLTSMWVLRPFAEAARKSAHHFETAAEEVANLFDAYTPTFETSGSQTWYFDQYKA